MPSVAGAHVARWLVLAPVVLNALTGPMLVVRAETGDERIVGILLTTFCTLAALVVWHTRHPAPAALRIGAWLVPATFGCIAVVMLAGGATGLGGYYAAIALLSAGGLALAPREA